MASIHTNNLCLSPDNEFCSFITYCEPIGAYVVVINSEKPNGAYAIFHIASSASDGRKLIKRTLSAAGENGEQLKILWPQGEHPVLMYEIEEYAPREDRHYNLKII